MDKAPIKVLLYQKCLEYIEQRIVTSRSAIDSALESGNDETKSSAGDKHETGRAMAQLEQEKSIHQLTEAVKTQEQLIKIDPQLTSAVISKGSLVITDNGNFYISIAAGKIIIDNINYFAISPLSPIAIAFIGKREKQKVHFNQLTYLIETIL